MNRQKLINGYAAAFKMGYSLSRDKFGLKFDAENRCYVIQANRLLNILESSLLGQEDCSGDLIVDIATALDSTEEFVKGFIYGLGFIVTPTDKPIA
jgi:hypothetical protein